MKLTITILLALIALQAFSQQVKPVSNKGSKPFVLGVIDEVYSKELGENRVLNIYLPEGYNSNDTAQYPVTYLLDGSANEDFIHVAGLYQFNTFEWVNRVPKSIVVGIATVDRRRDFTFPTRIKSDKSKYPTAGGSDKFIAFIEKELKPFITANYKTSGACTIIGQSFGGLLATEILLKKPALFNNYIIISPGLWWDNGSLLNQPSELLKADFSEKTEVYIAVGKEGLTPTEIPRVMETDANLLAEKIKGTKRPAVTVYFDYLPQENHATISHQAILNALTLIYKNTKK